MLSPASVSYHILWENVVHRDVPNRNYFQRLRWTFNKPWYEGELPIQADWAFALRSGTAHPLQRAIVREWTRAFSMSRWAS